MFDFFWSQETNTRAKILIVDDDPNIVQTLRDNLEMNDFTVITADNGEEGLRKAAEEVPDVILLDVNMPVMGGYEMLEYLRMIGECRNVAVMMITGEDDTRSTETIIACGGMDEYIAKPFDFSILLKKIESAIKNINAVKV